MQVKKSNKAAVCNACIKKLGRELALERPMYTNTKVCVKKAHLRKCRQFAELYAEEERAEILYGSDEESQQIKINTSSITTSSSFLLSSSGKNHNILMCKKGGEVIKLSKQNY